MSISPAGLGGRRGTPRAKVRGARVVMVLWVCLSEVAKMATKWVGLSEGSLGIGQNCSVNLDKRILRI